ncbi:MAG: FHA domain-containing protein [Anaerolineae bacterium]|nr:FHA domain-containing protein [Anaerolineae bacterium]
MANPLSHLENLAEQLVEGTFARILGARLQPIEVARHLARAMEDGQVINAQGEIVVPNEYRVLLNPGDEAAMAQYRDALEKDLTQYVSKLARRAGATMVGRPRVLVRDDPAVPPKRVRVEAQLVSAKYGAIDLTHTQEMPAGALTLEEIAPAFALFDGYRRMPLDEAIVSMGRSLNNDIVLDDPRISRQHAQLRRRYGQYVLYDLDSTGGTTVNGLRVREAVLNHGDVIGLAGVKVRFERADAPSAPAPSPNATQILPGRGPRP